MSHLICYCFRVEKDTIVSAIEAGCDTVEALSARLRVCTGCGGCRPDLENLIRFYREENRLFNLALPEETKPASLHPDRPT